MPNFTKLEVELWNKLLQTCCFANSFILLITMFIGVFLADIFFSMGIHRKIGRPPRPLLRSAGLPEELSVPIMTEIIDFRAECERLTLLFYKFHVLSEVDS